MRGRPKKYSIDKSRTATIKLTGPASFLLSEIRKQSKSFDFSKYVSNRLLLDFHERNKEEICLQELQQIQLEQDMMNDKFNNMKRAKAIQLANIKEKMQSKVQ
jgi:uncharacterized protein (UPF0128 family)